MAKFAYAECYYPDSANQVLTIEAESIDEARKKIIKRYEKDLLLDDEDTLTLTSDWHDFLRAMEEICETIIGDPINIEYL